MVNVPQSVEFSYCIQSANIYWGPTVSKAIPVGWDTEMSKHVLSQGGRSYTCDHNAK